MEQESHLPDYAVPHTSEHLLLLLEQQRHVLMETIRALNDEQIETALDGAGWSVKDHLAHLTSWAAGMVGLLRKENRWTAMGLGPEGMETDGGYEAINARLRDLHKDEPLDKVLTDFNDTHGHLIQAVQAVGRAGIHKPYRFYAPEATGNDNEEPVLNWLVGNSYGHYAEHLAWIKTAIKEKGW